LDLELDGSLVAGTHPVESDWTLRSIPLVAAADLAG